MLHLIDNLFPPHLPPRSLSLSSSSLLTSIWHFPIVLLLHRAFIYLLPPSLSYSLIPPSSSSHSTIFPSPYYLTSHDPRLSYLYRPCFLLPCTPLYTSLPAPFILVSGLFSTTLHFYTPVSLPISLLGRASHQEFLYPIYTDRASSRDPPKPPKSLDTDSSTPSSLILREKRQHSARTSSPIMAGTMADDELFTRAISGYRDAFLDRHSHLPESERNELWSQRLSQFMTTTASSSISSVASSSYRPVPGSGLPEDGGAALEKSGKRLRQDTPRTLPGSGLPPPKRRVTVCDLSWSSAPASPAYLRFYPSCPSRAIL